MFSIDETNRKIEKVARMSAALRSLTRRRSQRVIAPNSGASIESVANAQTALQATTAPGPSTMDQHRARAAASEPPTTVDESTTEAFVSLFGQFRVTLCGADLPIPPGHPTTIVKLLSLTDRPLVVDELIDTLWPEADCQTGRRRLRNVLWRLRSACGDLVIRNGDVVQLHPIVRCDIQQGRQAAAEALSPRRTESAVAAAIRLNEPPLLVEDRYEDWAEEARRQQRALLLRLLDVQAALAEQVEDIDLLVTSLEHAHLIDPCHQDRIGRASELLRSHGRLAEADALQRHHDDAPSL